LDDNSSAHPESIDDNVREVQLDKEYSVTLLIDGGSVMVMREVQLSKVHLSMDDNGSAHLQSIDENGREVQLEKEYSVTLLIDGGSVMVVREF